jgi:hypothetical protein
MHKKTAECAACDKKSVTRNRTLMPAIAVTRPNVVKCPLVAVTDKQSAIEFKCRAHMSLSKESSISVKAGIASSDNPIGQGIQSLVSSVLPGDLKNPLRSAAWSMLVPGGSGIPNPLARASAGGFPKPERGFRCPEGFQFGGRFTDKLYTTCGKRLFELATSIASGLQNVSELASRNTPREISTAGRVIKPLIGNNQVSLIRQPNIIIPKVSRMNFDAYKKAIANVVQEMRLVSGSVSRIVRRDGVVLTPVVSSRVLRTVPDNRDMEAAAYIQKVVSASEIGKTELGMLSNTGINSVIYVLPDGSTISLRKKRNLTSGERRKLGRTVADAERMKMGQNPASRLEMIAAEMNGAIAYEQKFENIKNPNDVIEVLMPDNKTKKQMRRWHHEAFIKYPKAVLSERKTQIEDESGFVESLSEAVKLINSGGQIGNIQPRLRGTALAKSKSVETRKINNRLIEHEIGRQKIYEVSPTLEYEHLGAMLSSEIQSHLGMLSPDIWFSGEGSRRRYLVSYPNDSVATSRSTRTASMNMASTSDMSRLFISDLLTDSKMRNPSSIYTILTGNKKRTFASPSIYSGLSGSSRKNQSDRINMPIAAILQESDKLTYKDYFEKLRKNQRSKALSMLDELLERARSFNFDDFANRASIDGQMSESEKKHIDIMKSLFEVRIRKLSTSVSLLKKYIGQSNE